MPTSVSPPASTPAAIEPSHSGDGPKDPGDHHGGGDGFGNWEPWGPATPPSVSRAGIYVGLASVSMLFASLTLIFVLRKGISGNWTRTPLPAILYFDTLILAASSGTLEMARRALSRSAMAKPGAFRSWLVVTLGLGLAFLGGQWLAWREFAAAGPFLTGNPGTAFFYLVTGAHGLHLAGGLLALLYLVLKARPIRWGLKRRIAVDVTSIYWHFMDGLWIYLFALLLILRS